MESKVWGPRNPENSRMWQFMQFAGKKYQKEFRSYEALHAWSVENCEQFWPTLQEFFGIQFATPAARILNDYQHMIDARWFSGASLNFTRQLLSRNDEHPAIISIDEQGSRQCLSYAELKQQVAFCAAGLQALGIGQGDRVAAVLPNVAYTIIAFLATASLGAIWSSCSPDFGTNAILDRLGQIEPKVLFISNGHQYHGKTHSDLDKIKLKDTIPSIEHVVVCPVLNAVESIPSSTKTMVWEEFLQPANHLEFVSVPFDHPLYILFSSGTTGKPKCIVHGTGGVLLQHVKELGLHTDINTHDNLFFYTTCGWMMWNWMVSVLALGATLTLYEGSPTFPTANRLFQLIDDEHITVFGTSAKFISSIEKAEVKPRLACSLASLRCILSTGSPLLPKNYDFVSMHVKPGVQLSSISGGTDIVSCFALGNPLLPVYRGELQCIGLGMSVNVFDEAGQPVREARGELVCTKPFPSMPVCFWNDADKKMYRRAYFERFPGIWAHGDFAEITKHHGLIIYGRSDTVLNPGGVRIGTAEIYRQVEKIPEVLDSLVIGQDWQDDVRIILFVKLKAGMTLDEHLKQTIGQTIRNNASPRHVPAKILQVTDIPRTINGKIVELAVRQIIHGQAINNLQSIANPEALDDFKDREELLF
ncbi:acetoacetate--CoA ligase [Legionella septentrionalis]|uniref:acetoacetate--CoA ligase n=1 Tax=Legionella septentrionalis TaxID=2498109 RepID=UPI000F8D8500|nr:acetoacetate--CoA ligase [Legionella septentrionalis]RUR00542.1 acetoacetate--CoA ligase [Legionella septentrionalis]